MIKQHTYYIVMHISINSSAETVCVCLSSSTNIKTLAKVMKGQNHFWPSVYKNKRNIISLIEK